MYIPVLFHVYGFFFFGPLLISLTLNAQELPVQYGSMGYVCLFKLNQIKSVLFSYTHHVLSDPDLHGSSGWTSG